MKKHRAIAWGFAVILLLTVVGVVAATQKTSPVSDDMLVASVKKGDLELKVYATGELRATHTIGLSAPTVSGGALQITRLLNTGASVKKGDVVFEFDPSEQQYNLEQSRSEFAQAEEEITKAMADAAVQTAQDKVALLKARFDLRRAELEVQKNELVSSIDAKKTTLDWNKQRMHLCNSSKTSNPTKLQGKPRLCWRNKKRIKQNLRWTRRSKTSEKCM